MKNNFTDAILYRKASVQKAALVIAGLEATYPDLDDRFGDRAGVAIEQCQLELGITSEHKHADAVMEAILSLSDKMTATLRKQRLLA